MAASNVGRCVLVGFVAGATLPVVVLLGVFLSGGSTQAPVEVRQQILGWIWFAFGYGIIAVFWTGPAGAAVGLIIAMTVGIFRKRETMADSLK